MLKSRFFSFALLVLSAAVVPAQTWVNVGGANQSWTTSASVTARFGYPDATGVNWITVQEAAGDFLEGPNGSQVPAAVATLANPMSLALEVDVLQSGTPVTIEEEDVWGGTGCETIITYSIPASGAVTSSQSVCPGSTAPPVTTPPVTTPPVTTPPVTTPLVTTPPVTVPAAPVTITLPTSTSLPMGCASGVVAGMDASGNAAGSYFYILCAQTPASQ